MMMVWRTTLAPIRNRLMPAGLEGGFAMQLRKSLGLPAPVLEYLVGDDQQKKSHARIKNKDPRIDDPARKGVHVVQLSYVSGDFPESGRRAVYDIIDEGNKEKANR